MRCRRETELENEDTGLGDPRADARGEGEVPTDQEVNRANEYLPSAMGISALLRLPGQAEDPRHGRCLQPREHYGFGRAPIRTADGRIIGSAVRLNARSISTVRISEWRSRWSDNIPSGTGTLTLS